jgi:hypothetical protein
MDLEFNDMQSMLADSLKSLLSRHAGPDRARQMMLNGTGDRRLAEALQAAGFLDLASSDGAGPLEAEIVVEHVARAAGVAPVGVRALVAPSVLDGPVPEFVAICELAAPGPVRYAVAADLIIVLDGATAGVLIPRPGEIRPADSVYGTAMGYVPTRSPDFLAPGPADLARRLWRVAIAARRGARSDGSLCEGADAVRSRDRIVPGRAAQACSAACRHPRVDVAGAGRSLERRSGARRRCCGLCQRYGEVGIGRTASADRRDRIHRGV